MIVTKEILKAAMPAFKDEKGIITPAISELNIGKYLPCLQIIVPNMGIDTPLRMAHFLAQIGHETLSFIYYREIASGAKYEGRKDLGNIYTGDGVKFRGRGCIQITGRANYHECSIFLYGDDRLITNPELLELPENGMKAACWFWIKNGINTPADRDDIYKVTRKVNGRLNGIANRVKRLELAKKALNL